MTAPELSSSELRDLFPAGTVMHNPVTGEYARVAEHTAQLAVGELLAVPGGAVAGPHLHPAQEERFEVIDGVMGYRLGDHRGELRAGEAVTVAPGVIHDWWNAGADDLRARVTVTPPGLFAGMIGRRGVACRAAPPPRACRSSRTPRCLRRRSPTRSSSSARRAVQRALAVTIAPIVRRRGRWVTGETMRAAIVPAAQWPGRLRLWWTVLRAPGGTGSPLASLKSDGHGG